MKFLDDPFSLAAHLPAVAAPPRAVDAAGRVVDALRDLTPTRDTASWFEMSNQLLCEASFEGQLTRVNDTWEDVLGYEKAELLGTPYLDLVHPSDRGPTMELAERLAESNRHEALFRNRLRAKDGSWRWISWTGRSDSRRIYAAGRDVTRLVSEEADQQEQLSQAYAMAHTDPLTGLPNRRAWDDAIHRELARSRRHGLDLSVAIVDLDNFKLYNDRNGHLAGDKLLKRSARRWRLSLRETDLLARVGGEEFAVLFPACGEVCASVAVERLRHATPPGVTSSLGVAHWNGEEDAEALFARADAALYRAKRDGRNQTAFAAA